MNTKTENLSGVYEYVNIQLSGGNLLNTAIVSAFGKKFAPKKRTSTPRTSQWFAENKVERVQAFINPKTEPELLEAYLFLVDHYKGKKKEVIANAIMTLCKKVKEENNRNKKDF